MQSSLIITYAEESLQAVDKKGWFIGWDYAHYGDYTGDQMMFPEDKTNDR